MVRAILYIGSRCPFEKRLIRYERVYFYSMVYADLESYRYCEFRFLRAVFVRSLLLHQLISVFLIRFLGYLENFQNSSIPILNFITHQMFCIIKRYCTNLFSNHFPERKRGWICYTFISMIRYLIRKNRIDIVNFNFSSVFIRLFIVSIHQFWKISIVQYRNIKLHYFKITSNASYKTLSYKFLLEYMLPKFIITRGRKNGFE